MCADIWVHLKADSGSNFSSQKIVMLVFRPKYCWKKAAVTLLTGQHVTVN